MATNIVSSGGNPRKMVDTEKIQPAESNYDHDAGITEAKAHDPREVFQETQDGVQFRNVTWQRATVLFLKIQFAMSVLSVPGALATLGAVGGALSIVGWEVLNTC
jgi:hypothetical protein